ncbi:hypothetical protein T11_17166 [Trichinella zimbabwensis]|uniref:Uncharacterized protein n=1 Tax=Trichinella zimbabwensis TaxID=268475 RepID=A0A0V1I0W8_9BILA|nr:hypothetical protein T11_17166 [Trichinella zimbabwensis]
MVYHCNRRPGAQYLAHVLINILIDCAVVVSLYCPECLRRSVKEVERTTQTDRKWHFIDCCLYQSSRNATTYMPGSMKIDDGKSRSNENYEGSDEVLVKKPTCPITLFKWYERVVAAIDQDLGLIFSTDILAMMGRQYIRRLAYIAVKVGEKGNLNLTEPADKTKRDQADRIVFPRRDF